jgi:hypothetical protein
MHSIWIGKATVGPNTGAIYLILTQRIIVGISYEMHFLITEDTFQLLTHYSYIRPRRLLLTKLTLSSITKRLRSPADMKAFNQIEAYVLANELLTP